MRLFLLKNAQLTTKAIVEFFNWYWCEKESDLEGANPIQVYEIKSAVF